MLSKKFNSNKVNGYSLIELIVTIVLTTIVIVIFYTILGPSQLRSVSPVIQIKATQLAQAYLEEISLKRYDENSPSGNGLRCNSPTASTCSATLTNEGETRSQFDDIDDYNGLNDTPPRDALGNIRSGFGSFSVNVVISYAGADFGFAPQDLKRIQLTVVSSEGDQFIFSDYRGNF